MKIPVMPFLTPPPAAISHGGWKLHTTDGDIDMPKEMRHWDYQTVLRLAAPISVDRRAVVDACQLDWDSGLAVVVLARSSRTNAEYVARRMEVPLSDRFDLAVELNLEGRELGGRLTLETLLLSTKPQALGRLSPHSPGSILWRCSHWSDLEGYGSQFPTDSADFAETGRDPKAGWELRIDLSEPEARFMTAVRLTMNSGHPAVLKLLRGEKDDGTEQLLRTLNWDVTRQMVQMAIQSDDVAGLDVDEYAVSVAGVLRNLVARYFPNDSSATLREWLQHDLSRIEIRLQHQCGILK